MAKWISPSTGNRSDAAHGYVHPILDTQSNLHVLLQSKVVRVLWNHTTAIGVEYVTKYVRPSLTVILPSKLLDSTADQTRKSIYARKLVVLAAGALSTPQILQRSGIGSSVKLSSLEIGTVVDLPLVGENYHDHNNCRAGSARVQGGMDYTGDLLLRQDPATLARAVEEYASGKGELAWNFIDAGSKLNPSPADLEKMGPDFQNVWNEFFAKHPDKAMMTVAISAMYHPSDSQLT